MQVSDPFWGELFALGAFVLFVGAVAWTLAERYFGLDVAAELKSRTNR